MSYLDLFVIGLFAANGLPHFVKGITGEEWWTPFGRFKKPRVKTSAVANVLWGATNWLICFGLLYFVGGIQPTPFHALSFAAGGLLMALTLARVWGTKTSM